MKKILCLVLALLCLSAYAMAESVPSKNTSDMCPWKLMQHRIQIFRLILGLWCCRAGRR